MIDTDLIIINECMEDGAVIHLYYNDKCDTWMAYGLSAYMPCHIGEISHWDILCAFSNEIQMPYVKADDWIVGKLSRNNSKEYGGSLFHLRFIVNESVSSDDYVRWVKNIKNQARYFNVIL